MIFESTPAAGAVNLMKSEVDQLLQPAGLALKWKLTSENRGN